MSHRCLLALPLSFPGGFPCLPSFGLLRVLPAFLSRGRGGLGGRWGITGVSRGSALVLAVLLIALPGVLAPFPHALVAVSGSSYGLLLLHETRDGGGCVIDYSGRLG